MSCLPLNLRKFCFLSKYGIKVKEIKSSLIKELIVSPALLKYASMSLKERFTKSDEMTGLVFIIDALKGTGHL